MSTWFVVTEQKDLSKYVWAGYTRNLSETRCSRWLLAKMITCMWSGIYAGSVCLKIHKDSCGWSRNHLSLSPPFQVWLLAKDVELEGFWLIFFSIWQFFVKQKIGSAAGDWKRERDSSFRDASRTEVNEVNITFKNCCPHLLIWSPALCFCISLDFLH